MQIDAFAGPLTKEADSPEVQSQINVLPQKYRQMAADTLPGVLKGATRGL
jgi:hypothetical protein